MDRKPPETKHSQLLKNDSDLITKDYIHNCCKENMEIICAQDML